MREYSTISSIDIRESNKFWKYYVQNQVIHGLQWILSRLHRKNNGKFRGCCKLIEVAASSPINKASDLKVSNIDVKAASLYLVLTVPHEEVVQEAQIEDVLCCQQVGL